MSGLLMPFSVRAVSAASNWGLASAKNQRFLGLNTARVNDVMDSVNSGVRISSGQAIDSFALVFGYAESCGYSPESLELVYAQLVHIGTPHRIREYMESLEHFPLFKDGFEGVMVSAEQARQRAIESGMDLYSADIAQANWYLGQHALNPRPFGGGGGSVRPSEKGPGLRAGRYRDAAGRRVIRGLATLTGSERRRLGRYNKLVGLALMDELSPGEFSARLRRIWTASESQLLEGGFLAPGRVAAITTKLDSGEPLWDAETVWDQTVKYLAVT